MFAHWGDDQSLQQRAVRTDLVLRRPADNLKWPIVERIVVIGMMILGCASVTVLLSSYAMADRRLIRHDNHLAQ